jgi:hypothetical protein
MLTVSSQQASTSRIIREDVGADGAMAGPSGVNTRQLVSSTPNIQSTGTHLSAGTEQKMNGMKILYDFGKILFKKLF